MFFVATENLLGFSLRAWPAPLQPGFHAQGQSSWLFNGLSNKVPGSNQSKNKMKNQTGLRRATAILAGILSVLATVGQTKGTTITVEADQVLHTNSSYLTGACLEDVNHEVYGGIDSQMIFGESFAEPAASLPLKGFKTYGGRWTPAEDGSVEGVGGDGSKIVRDGPAMSAGEVSVDVKLSEASGLNTAIFRRRPAPRISFKSFQWQ